MAGEQIVQTVLNAQERASVKQVFGEPTQNGDRTVIPVAAISQSFMFGWGGGPEKTNAQGERVRIGGEGASGNVVARPIAVVELTPQETRVIPVQDETRVTLAGMALGGWSIFWITATLRKLIGRKK